MSGWTTADRCLVVVKSRYVHKNAGPGVNFRVGHALADGTFQNFNNTVLEGEVRSVIRHATRCTCAS